MVDILSYLKSDRVLLSDGAWGTMLQSRGLQSGECPENWNLTHPDSVKEVASAYINAGSRVILTNTFGASPFKLDNYGLRDKTREINEKGVIISKEAAADSAYVAASVGPTGKFLQPLGEISEGEMYDAFCEQISGLADGGADAILIETMSDIGEAVIAVKAAKDVSSVPVMATMTFERGKQGYKTMMGIDIEQAVEALSEAGVSVLGTNCGNGIEQVTEIITEMKKYTSKPLIAHPNAGLPRLEGDRTIFDQKPEVMARYIPNLINSGAQIVGGCCGTTPEHIKAMAKQLESMSL
ncbi:methionine synthase [candidate division KSB1 bacterium]|nr:methionine synthase [candidate division KSB1 bacterium]